MVRLWSADDKNKLLIGGGSPVVSRYQSFGTYFKKGDELHSADHNFSTGYKAIASGYMRMELKDLSDSIKFKTDKFGRLGFRFPRTGHLYITLRGNKFFKSTAFNHYDDLLPLIREIRDSQGKFGCIMVCDNGPDWKKLSLKVMIVVGRLWRDLNFCF